MMVDGLSPVNDIASCYMDDVIIGTWVEKREDLLLAHEKDVRKVFDLLQGKQLVADIKNASFLCPRWHSLGKLWG